MSTTESQAIRQWVSAPGGSCDVRAGAGVIESCGRSLATLVGKPRLCALVSPSRRRRPSSTTCARPTSRLTTSSWPSATSTP